MHEIGTSVTLTDIGADSLGLSAGMVGKIIDIDDFDNELPYLVEFEGYGSEWVCIEDIEIADKEEEE